MESHGQQVDECRNLISCCIKNKAYNKPFWNVDVQPYKAECIWWDSAWKHAGRPGHGYIFEAMREAKRQYMYAKRRLKRKDDQLREVRMAEMISEHETIYNAPGVIQITWML